MDIKPLAKFFESKKMGMLGFGAQGKAEARNLKRSGVEFSLGLREGASAEAARSEGFRVLSIQNCVESSDILFLNVPDQIQAKIYDTYIKGKSKLQWIVFAHGFSTHFKKIPHETNGPDHILIAPKGAASGLEAYYNSLDALPAVLAYQNSETSTPSPQQKEAIESLALALGANPRALFWASFKDECVCDLFSEQALLCGGVSQLIQKTYEVLTEAGYNPETAYFETLFELKLIVDLIWKNGISGMRSKISPTARFGDITRGSRIVDESTKLRMKEILLEIETGKFTEEFLKEIDSNSFQQKVLEQSQHPIEKLGEKLRAQMRGEL